MVALTDEKETVYDTLYRQALNGNPEAWDVLSKSAFGGNQRSKQLINLLDSYDVKPNFEPILPETRQFKLPSLKSLFGGVINKVHEKRIDRNGDDFGV